MVFSHHNHPQWQVVIAFLVALPSVSQPVYFGDAADFLQDANPRGKIKTLFGLSVYQTHARNARNSKGRILLLPDAFGLASHNQVLADNFAASGNMNHLDGHQDLHRLTIRRLKGFDVLILDYFQGNQSHLRRGRK